MNLCLLARSFKTSSSPFLSVARKQIFALVLLLIVVAAQFPFVAAQQNSALVAEQTIDQIIFNQTNLNAGGVRREYWLNVAGSSVDNIPLFAAPTNSDFLTSLEAPTNWNDNYGTRIRGYITAPTTGVYTFWIAGDDNSELWLSSSQDAAQKTKIATVVDWTNPREWTKFANQKSQPISLTANQSYYFEILHKDGVGGDHLAVGWAKPGQSNSAPSEIIPGSVLSEYVDQNPGERARRADDFVDSIGVNIHLGYTEGIYGDYNGAVKARLQELGVRHVRDGLQPRRSDVAAKIKDLYTTLNIRSLLIINPNQHTATEARDFIKNTIGVEKVAAVEGINEPNLFIGGSNWAQITRDFQRDVYQAFKNDAATANVLFVAPSLVMTDAEATAAHQLGDLSAYADFGNIHNYYGGRNPETAGWGGNGYGGLNWNLNVVAPPVSRAKPVFSTETGWHNAYLTQSGHKYTPEMVVARYLPRLFLHQFNRGVARTYPYELFDQGTDQTDLEQIHGLLRRDNSAKPAFVALKNLIAILKDPGAPFATSKLNYGLGGNLSNLHHTLLQKRDGAFYLILWVAAQRWNPDAAIETEIPAQTVTLTLPNQSVNIKTFSPVESAAATNSFQNASAATLQVADQPLIIEIKPANRAAAISGAVTYAIAANAQTTKSVPDVTLNAAGASSATAITNAAGAYQFDNLNAGAYTITPFKNTHANGITSLDAARIRRYLLGATALDANQLIAADANADNRVDSQDAALIQQYVVGAASQQQVGKWKFLAPSRNYTDLTADQNDQNFQAVLLGEVTGDWTPPTTPRAAQINAPVENQSAADSVTASLPADAAARSNSIVEIPIKVTSLPAAIESFDFAVAFDPNVLKPIANNATNTTNTLSGTSNFNVVAGTNQSGKIVVSGASSGGTIPAGAAGTLINLRFEVVADANSAAQQTALTFVSTAFNPFPIVFNDNAPSANTIAGRFRLRTTTASAVNFSGRIATANNRGVAKAVIAIADEAGNVRRAVSDRGGAYRFVGVPSGATYLITVSAPKYRFREPIRVQTVTAEVLNFDFVADN